MSTANLVEMADQDVVNLKASLLQQLMVTRFEVRVGSLRDTSRAQKLRSDFARVSNELRRREIVQGLAKGSLMNASVKTDEQAGGEGKRSRFGLGNRNDGLLNKQSA